MKTVVVISDLSFLDKISVDCLSPQMCVKLTFKIICVKVYIS